ncbi:hypothetical protein BGS_0948 [Beggiatoa sp. SS]|nr:hypothetical protein BGS_0948 [Beggiatoa sp. SS]
MSSEVKAVVEGIVAEKLDEFLLENPARSEKYWPPNHWSRLGREKRLVKGVK